MRLSLSAIAACTFGLCLSSQTLAGENDTDVLTAVRAGSFQTVEHPSVKGVTQEEFQSLVYAYDTLLAVAYTAADTHLKQPKLDDLLKGRTPPEILNSLNPSYDYSYDEIYGLIETKTAEMLRELDPHSAFIPENKQEQAYDLIEGRTKLLGISFTEKEGRIQLGDISRGSPAEAAGLKTGDIIITDGDRSFEHTTFDRFDDHLSRRDHFSFKVERRGEVLEQVFNVEKAFMIKDVVYPSLYNNEIGYFYIEMFTSGAHKEFREKLENFLNAHNDNLKGLIIDLRSNKGGSLHAGIDIIDQLSNENILGFVQDMTQQGLVNKAIEVQNNTRATQLPITILVDGFTRSTAEFVAQALKDTANATIIADGPTAGKGVSMLRRNMPLHNGHKIHFGITSRYLLTPQKGYFQHSGVEIDTIVPMREDKREHIQFYKPFYEHEYTHSVPNPSTLQNPPPKSKCDGNNKAALTDTFSVMLQQHFKQDDISQDIALRCALDSFSGTPQYSVTISFTPSS